MTQLDTNVVVRGFTAHDQSAILALLETSLGHGPTGNRTAEFFNWKHRASPFGQSAGLVAEHDGRIVGVRLFLRWHLETFGQPVQAVRAVDTATHPEYQGRGIFRRLTLELLEQLEAAGEADLVFNTPNNNSRPGYLKMGWQTVGTLPVRLRPVRPIRLLAGARAATQAIATATRKSSRSTKSRRIPVCPFEPAGPLIQDRRHEIQGILKETAVLPGLHTPRTLSYLTWRYGQAPGLDYRCIVHETGGLLSGIAFGRLRRRGSLTEFTLSDLIARDGDRGTARRLLVNARRSGADHVALHATPGTETAAVALAAGYLSVPHYGLGLVVNPRRRLPVDPLKAESWQLSLGDLEVF